MLNDLFNYLFQSGEVRKKAKHRPPMKLLDREAIEALGGVITSKEHFVLFQRNTYSKDGFLYKNFDMSTVMSDGL